MKPEFWLGIVQSIIGMLLAILMGVVILQLFIANKNVQALNHNMTTIRMLVR